MDHLNMIHDRHLEQWQVLLKRWQLTCELWDDPVRRHFERESWQPLEAETVAMHREMEALIQTISEAQRRVR